MAKIEYYNPNPYKVTVVSIDGTKTIVHGYKRVVLEEAASIEPSDSLKVIRRLPSPKTVHATRTKSAKPPRGKIHKITPAQKAKNPVKRNKKRAMKAAVVGKSKTVKREKKNDVTKQVLRNARRITRRNRNNRLGFRIASAEKASEEYLKSIKSEVVPVSTNIAVGILSYNRLHCIKRAIRSIRQNTNLAQVTLFVSDESTDQNVKSWLRDNAVDFVLLDNHERLGVAGNSNRLLKCMSRFKHCFLFNDDIEVLKPGWMNHYIEASKQSGINHFCYRQPGLIGATLGDGVKLNFHGISVQKITSKPHGAVMYYTHKAFEKVGYFEEGWGEYGMEHVDWSNRVCLAGLQPKGYYDVPGSNKFFKIHGDKSATSKINLKTARKEFQAVENDNSRIFVNHSDRINIPGISYVIPIRDIERSSSIKTVINNIRAQRFPVVDITLIEEDRTQNTNLEDIGPVTYRFVKSSKNEHFNKSKAFNVGIMNAKYDHIVMHDGDIMVDSWYTKKMYNLLQSYEGVHVGKDVLYFTNTYTGQINAKSVVGVDGKCTHKVGYFEGGSLGCTKRAFVNIGGFNEDFVGYGCEDCDFFIRLKNNSKFYDARSETFYHLWHGRVAGWKQCHDRNKSIMDRCHAMPVQAYLSQLKQKLVSRYGKT